MSLIKLAYVTLVPVGTLCQVIKNIVSLPETCLEGILDLPTPWAHCSTLLERELVHVMANPYRSMSMFCLAPVTGWNI